MLAVVLAMSLILHDQLPQWSARGAVVDNWCDLDTGPADLLDLNKQKHSVYASVTRDGSVWVRLGLDHSPHMDWSLIERKKFRVQTPFLNDSEISLLQNLTYSDYCVVTDLDLQLNVASAWNPSFVTFFDPASKEVKILSLKNIRDCSINTRISLTSNGQSLKCEGSRVGSCTFKNVPVKDPPTTRSPTFTSTASPGNTSLPTSPAWFIKYVSLDLHGPDFWVCPAQEEKSWYTFNGSFYHVYVKVDACNPPNDSRALGDEVKLRREKDTSENLVLLPNPSQSVLAPGLVNAWQFFAKIVSLEHTVHLQIWRPAGQSHKSQQETHAYRLVDQTFVHPRDLRVHEVVLERPFQVLKGDVIGLYFPKFNPIGWSSVPCSDDHLQRHRFHRNPNRKIMHPGVELPFTSATEGDGTPCRSYSVMAFFANKSNLKLLENWGCPSRLNHEAPGSTVSNKRSNVEWQHRARVNSADHGTSIHDSPSLDPADQPLSFWGYHSPHNSSPLTLVHAIAVLVTASLLVAMMVLGLVSYKLSVGSCVN